MLKAEYSRKPQRYSRMHLETLAMDMSKSYVPGSYQGMENNRD